MCENNEELFFFISTDKKLRIARDFYLKFNRKEIVYREISNKKNILNGWMKEWNLTVTVLEDWWDWCNFEWIAHLQINEIPFGSAN